MLIHASDLDPESQSATSNFRTDRTHADDEHGGIGQEDGGSVHVVDHTWPERIIDA